MKTVLTKLNIPENMQIGGSVENIASRLQLMQTTQGQITGARIEMEMKCTVDIQGVIVEYTSQISHTLTKKEMDELMLKFNE